MPHLAGARTKLSQSHLYEGRTDGRDGAKKFQQVLIILVALEVAARRLGAHHVNIYNFVRIVPAFYFCDRLTVKRLEQIDSYYSKLSDEKKQELAGAAAAGMDFSTLCAVVIGQPRSEILRELALGYTATKPVCLGIVEFVNNVCPANLHIGPVRVVGDDQGTHDSDLGTHRAAPHLKVPYYLEMPL